jgi:hypothetical protein
MLRLHTRLFQVLLPVTHYPLLITHYSLLITYYFHEALIAFPSDTWVIG